MTPSTGVSAQAVHSIVLAWTLSLRLGKEGRGGKREVESRGEKWRGGEGREGRTEEGRTEEGRGGMKWRGGEGREEVMEGKGRR